MVQQIHKFSFLFLTNEQIVGAAFKFIRRIGYFTKQNFLAAVFSPDLNDLLVRDADDLLIRQEQEAEFMNLLNQLPLPQRSVLLLHFVEDFSLEEIARITETQIGTVKSRIHYAKRALRKLLEGIEQ